MFDITRLWSRKKNSSTAKLAGALSLAAVSGALLTWYTTRKVRKWRENEFLYSQDEESQP